MKLGICQVLTTSDKKKNILNAEEKIKELTNQDVDIILLPECFNCPYGIEFFADYSEEFNINNLESITYKFFNKISKEYPNIYFFFGSIPERENDKIYNTMAIFYQGCLIDKFRKIHLYDFFLDGKHSFQESKVLSSGEMPVIIKTDFGNIGIGICYDIRFPKLAEYYRKNNCKLIVYPGAFNLITGEAHWELLQKARALDNMLFIATASTARNDNANYKSWGHSTIVNPWGKVINKLDEKEGIIIQNLDMNEIDRIRNNIPTFKNFKKIDLI